MYGVNVVGNINDVEKLKDLLINDIYPEKVKL